MCMVICVYCFLNVLKNILIRNILSCDEYSEIITHIHRLEKYNNTWISSMGLVIFSIAS